MASAVFPVRIGSAAPPLLFLFYVCRVFGVMCVLQSAWLATNKKSPSWLDPRQANHAAFRDGARQASDPPPPLLLYCVCVCVHGVWCHVPSTCRRQTTKQHIAVRLDNRQLAGAFSALLAPQRQAKNAAFGTGARKTSDPRPSFVVVLCVCVCV